VTATNLRESLARHPMLDELTNRQLDAIVEIVDAWRRPAPAADRSRNPQPGEVWRERRRQYNKRTVLVLGADRPESGGFVKTRSLTDFNGHPMDGAPTTRTRLTNWHKTFEFEREMADTFADLIEASSLGTPEARRYRDTTPAEVRKQILDGLKDGEVGERD
jgi:hypothetical protein